MKPVLLFVGMLLLGSGCEGHLAQDGGVDPPPYSTAPRPQTVTASTVRRTPSAPSISSFGDCAVMQTDGARVVCPVGCHWTEKLSISPGKAPTRARQVCIRDQQDPRTLQRTEKEKW